MDLRDLEYFHAIVHTGSINAAAIKVGRTPPALTKAIRRLEESIGVKLFDRVGRGIVINSAGRSLAAQTRGLVDRLSAVRNEVRAVANGHAGHVRVGVAATMAICFLPALVERLDAELPSLTLNVVNGMNDVLRAALIAGEIDVILGPIDQPHPSMSSYAVATDVVKVVASPQHRLVSQQPSLADLLDERWVLPSRNVATRKWFDAAFIAAGLEPVQPYIETNSIATLEALIFNTTYLSFVSSWKLEAQPEPHSLCTLNVPGLCMQRRMGALWLTNTPTSGALSAFLGLVRRSGA